MLTRAAFVLAVLSFAASAAGAPVIGSITPERFKVSAGEPSMTIAGTELYGPDRTTAVIFEGGQGTFEITPSGFGYYGMQVWVPAEIINNAGLYTVRVRITKGAVVAESGTRQFEVAYPPGAVLQLPSSSIIQQATSKDGARVEFTVSGSSTADGSPLPVTCDHQSGGVYPFGSTLVRCSVTDHSGQQTSGAFQILVVDFVAPKITVPADILVEATGPNGAVVDYTVTAEDAVDGTLQPRCAPPAGSLFAIKTTVVRCDAVDAHFNSVYGEFQVTVVNEHTRPLLELPATITAEATEPGGAVVFYSASAKPRDPGEMGYITSFECSAPSGSLFPVGTTTISCTALDTQGATTTGTFDINVVDTTGPVLTLPEDITSDDGVVTFIATAIDLVDGSISVTCTPPSGSTFATGTTTVTCSATDAHGNTATGSFTVTVADANADTTPPEVTSIRATPDVLSPPNHKMVPVEVTVTAVDDTDPGPVSRIVNVYADERMDRSDWRLTGPLTLELRAERTGQTDNRIYFIVVETSDSSGNITASLVTVRVPHDSNESAVTVPPPTRRRAARH